LVLNTSSERKFRGGMWSNRPTRGKTIVKL